MTTSPQLVKQELEFFCLNYNKVKNRSLLPEQKEETLFGLMENPSSHTLHFNKISNKVKQVLNLLDLDRM